MGIRRALGYAWKTIIDKQSCCAVVSAGKNATTICLGKLFAIVTAPSGSGGLCEPHFRDYCNQLPPDHVLADLDTMDPEAPMDPEAQKLLDMVDVAYRWQERWMWRRLLRQRVCPWCFYAVPEGAGVCHAFYQVISHEGECSSRLGAFQTIYDRSARGRYAHKIEFYERLAARTQLILRETADVLPERHTQSNSAPLRADTTNKNGRTIWIRSEAQVRRSFMADEWAKRATNDMEGLL